MSAVRKDTLEAVCARVFVAICAWLTWAPVMSIELDRLDSQLAVQAWDSQSGLPSDAVWDVHIADDGYLWVATEGGLVRFDGVEFTVFNSKSHDAFAVDDVRRIAAARDGSLWLATYGGGVVHMDGNALNRYGGDEGLDNPVVFSVKVMLDGTVWAATTSSACRLIDERFECFDAKDGLGSSRIFDIAQARDGTTWFSSLSSGASSFDGRQFNNYTTEFGDSTPPVFIVEEDPQFDIIFGTYTGDFFTFNAQGFEPVVFDGVPDNMIPIAFFRDQHDNVWVGSNTHGLVRVLPGLRQIEGSLADSQVFSIAEAADGSLWLATTSGLRALSAPPIVPWGEAEGIADDTFVVAEAPDGSIWSGTEADGLFRLGTDGRIQQFTVEDGLPAASVATVMIMPDGTVWAGTFTSGLAWLRDGKVIGTLDTEDGLASNQVTALHREDTGTVWVGTANGIDRIVDGNITHHLGSEDGLTAALIRHIGDAGDGRLLLATDNGLAVVDTQQVTVTDVLDSSDGLATDIVATSYIDSRGVIWIGGRSGGLTRIENGQAFAFVAQHGLGIDSIMGIVEDTSGYLWLGGRNGISRIERRQLDAVAAGAAPRVEARPLTLNDGLRSTRIPGGFHAPMIRAGDGRVWMATGAGLAAVDPLDLQPRGSGLTVKFDSILADGESVLIDQQTTLPPGTQAMQINYSVPLLRNGKSLRFRYRLNNGDGRWQYAGERRTAYFTSLAPRDYVLEVQASLDGLGFADAESNVGRLAFRVAPKIYQTTTAKIAMSLAAFALLVLIYQYLVRSYRHREQRLESLVTARTSELVAALEEVKRLSRTDTLTQVANRRHFEERLQATWAAAAQSGSPVSVMIIDIDHFKAFNDTAGHQAGDRALKTVAQTLAKEVRDQDFVARYGGEEFIILLDGTDIDVAQQVGRRVQNNIRALNIGHPGLDNGQVLTVSAGFASAQPGDIGNVEALIRRADEALYRAKADGRDRLVTDARGISGTGAYATFVNLREQ